MNTVAASLNTTVRQITEMSPWPKCLSKKNDRNVSAETKSGFDALVHPYFSVP